eukprot:TRINITY_DN2997_c0_g1_i1.p1 TRINITY_DN2997_c0_g1~~TRINITY_DN2997_c0_g1_i1.p1  ORF type:complete len:335 (+),score=67.80 TRINITY_DN2997_c0_g1_i1:70-1074(+)
MMRAAAVAVAALVPSALANICQAPPEAAMLENPQWALCVYSNCLRRTCENFEPAALMGLVPKDMAVTAQSLMNCQSFVTLQCNQTLGELALMQAIAPQMKGTEMEAILQVKVDGICNLADDPARTAMVMPSCCAAKPDQPACTQWGNYNHTDYNWTLTVTTTTTASIDTTTPTTTVSTMKPVVLQMTVQNVDYSKLVANATLKKDFEAAIATEVAAAAGDKITKDDVKVTLAQGSVKATVEITPPADMATATLSTTLGAATTTLTSSVVTALKAVDGISVAASGELSVSGVAVDDDDTTDSTTGEATASSSVLKASPFGMTTLFALTVLAARRA